MRPLGASASWPRQVVAVAVAGSTVGAGEPPGWPPRHCGAGPRSAAGRSSRLVGLFEVDGVRLECWSRVSRGGWEQLYWIIAGTAVSSVRAAGRGGPDGSGADFGERRSGPGGDKEQLNGQELTVGRILWGCSHLVGADGGSESTRVGHVVHSTVAAVLALERVETC